MRLFILVLSGYTYRGSQMLQFQLLNKGIFLDAAKTTPSSDQQGMRLLVSSRDESATLTTVSRTSSSEPRVRYLYQSDFDFLPESRTVNVMVFSGATMTPTQTELANAEFLQRVVEIPGVLRVLTTGGRTLSEQSVIVFVPALRTPIAHEVYKIEADIYRKYPTARFEVDVKDRRVLDKYARMK